METLTFPHFTTELQALHLAHFTCVRNASELRTRLIAASTMAGDEGERERAALNFAFVDARVLTSREHLLTGCHQAMIACARGPAAEGNVGGMRTKTPHSEVLFALNPTHNIADSIRRFGVSATTQSLVAVRIAAPPSEGGPAPSEVLESMRAIIQGDLVPKGLSGLSGAGEPKEIRKTYKLGAEVQDAQVDRLVTSIVAMKSVAA